MIFCIALALIAVSLIVAFVVWFRFDEGWPFAVPICLAVVSFLAIAPGASDVETTPTLQSTMDLRALVTRTDTESSASGAYFLGFGYASSASSEVQSVYYIQTAADGGSTLEKTSIDRVVIYEDGASAPYVEDWVSAGTDDSLFWVPWVINYTVPGEPEHHFHIPEGAILENYVVEP